MLDFIDRLFTIIYAMAAIILTSIAIIIMGWSCYEIISSFTDEYFTTKMFILSILQSVGAIIISIAIIDVSKYIFEEEVLRNKELRKPREARETLTKIMVIACIAVTMEGLVYIFKAGTTDLKLLIYPALLIVSAVLIMIGLGIYQKFSKSVEKMD